MMSLHQWPNREKVLAEACRVLKDGGLAVVIVGSLFIGRKELEAIFKAVGFKDIQLSKKGIVVEISGQNLVQ